MSCIIHCNWTDVVVADDVCEGSVRIPEEKLDLNKANPRVGIGAVAFSSDSRYMYTRNGKLWDSHIMIIIYGLITSSCDTASTQPMHHKVLVHNFLYF